MQEEVLQNLQKLTQRYLSPVIRKRVKAVEDTNQTSRKVSESGTGAKAEIDPVRVMLDASGEVVIEKTTRCREMGGLGNLFFPWGLLVKGIARWPYVKGRREGDGSPLLSVGAHCAGNRTVALRQAAAGRVLVVDHHFRRSARSWGVRFCGDDTGSGVAARDVSGLRTTVEDPGARDADSGQSFGWKSGRVGGIMF